MGGALTLFAVLAKATWNGKLYWVFEIGHPEGVFGPIIYHNQAGSILMMSLAASIYCLACGMADDQESAPTAAGSHGPTADVHLQWRSSAASWQDWLQPRPLALSALVLVNLAGLLLTLSRGLTSSST